MITTLINRWKKLDAMGVLGMNARNANLIQRYNPRSLFPNADSKIRAKALAQEASIPVTALYGCLRSIGQFQQFFSELEHTHFVVKPEHGSGGEGVLVLEALQDGSFQRASGVIISSDELKLHVANTISGLYSLGGQPDSAMIEYRVQFDPVFERITFRGVPDIRIIVFKGVPIAAMLRLPTEESNGRANLHQGAVGVGVDIASGLTRHAIHGTLPVELHPDTGTSVLGFQVPYWEEMLSIASKSYDVFKLGYFGIDLVLDETLGPLLLEVNVRPGLAIQLANRFGLKKRVELVEQKDTASMTATERVSFTKEHIALTS